MLFIIHCLHINSFAYNLETSANLIVSWIWRYWTSVVVFELYLIIIMLVLTLFGNDVRKPADLYAEFFIMSKNKTFGVADITVGTIGSPRSIYFYRYFLYATF